MKTASGSSERCVNKCFDYDADVTLTRDVYFFQTERLKLKVKIEKRPIQGVFEFYIPVCGASVNGLSMSILLTC